MRVYLVRHGETTGNRERIHQLSETPLSRYGHQQALMLSKRVSKLPIDMLLSSDMKRTLQTASHLAKTLKTPVIATPLLREIKRPTEILGRPTRNPEVIEIKKQLEAHAMDEQWHYSDEENFYDLKKRTLEVVSLLEERREKNILCVAHGMIIRILVSAMVYRDSLSVDIFKPFAHAFSTENTGLTICDYSQKSGTWRILTWNDHAHLAE